MAIMALHEDGPLSDYAYFPIVKLDFEYFTNTLGVSPTWGSYTEGTSFGKRFNFSVTNDFIFRGLSSNCPRTVFDDASIIKNNNTWELVGGVYSRPNTVMTRIDNEQPEDWSTNIHYYTVRINTPTETEPNQYAVFVPKKRGGTFSTTTTYYRDDSEPEKRQQRLFYADTGLSFEVNAQANFTSTGATAQPFKYYSICCWNGNSNSNSSTVMSYPEYWAMNSSVFNPTNESFSSYDVGFRNWYTISPATASTLTGWSRLLDEAPTAMFFVETTVENVKYYGIALVRLSSTDPDAYPVYISCKFFESVYWGTSIIAGGEIPAGEWGPVSGQAGGTGGTWDYTSDIVPLQSVDDLPTAISAGSVIKCYGIDGVNMNHLAERLYNSESNIWTAWSNKLYNPSAAIIALHYLPTIFSGNYDPENLSRISFAGRTMDGTADYDPVNGYLQYNQWRNSPLFSLSVPALADSFLDYAPFTRMMLHVPFCGVLPIDPSAVTGGTITVYFRCDAISGAVSARIECVDKFGNSTISYIIGNCAYQIPIAGRTGGAAGLSALAGLASAAVGTGLVMSGNFAGGWATLLGGGISAITNTARDEATQAAVSNVSGNVAPILDLCLWLEISRSVPSTPADKQALQGVPANTTVQLLQLSGTGYAEISEIHLENIPASRGELEEIETLLKNGVIF